MPIFELGWAIPTKSHVWKFGSDWLSLSRVIIWIFFFWRGVRNPLLEGLHVACDAHLWMWPSYSSQKSCVKIWFRLVEPFKSYRVHKHFSEGTETPVRGGYIWSVMPIFELGCALPVKSHVLKFGLDWLKLEAC